MLDAERTVCATCSPTVAVMTLALAELVAGKTKALFDRLAVRDLYDIYRIHTGASRRRWQPVTKICTDCSDVSGSTTRRFRSRSLAR